MEIRGLFTSLLPRFLVIRLASLQTYRKGSRIFSACCGRISSEIDPSLLFMGPIYINLISTGAGLGI